MFSTIDTIVAIATPAGRGAIGVVRLSGPDSLRIACALTSRSRPLQPRHATTLRLRVGDLRDTVVITAFPGPASYTGDDVVEISAHGSRVVLSAIVTGCMAEGARLAAPGEFTLRAFINGKIDLAQAEAVADLIDAATPLQARSAFDQLSGTLSGTVARLDATLFDLAARLEASVDFPDEGFHFVDAASVATTLDGIVMDIDGILSSARRGRLVREGAQVVIAGRPNVGKSSLFNALVGSHRAIVTPVAGTTRDMLTEVVDLKGLRVTLVDTAGLVETRDLVEREGVARTNGALAVADLVLFACDSESAWLETGDVRDRIPPQKLLTVRTKADLGQAAWVPPGCVAVSSVSGTGLDALVERIHEALAGDVVTETPLVSNLRHIELLTRTRDTLRSASLAICERGTDHSEEFVLADLQEARALLESVTGQRSADDTLIHIFERFCVGK